MLLWIAIWNLLTLLRRQKANGRSRQWYTPEWSLPCCLHAGWDGGSAPVTRACMERALKSACPLVALSRVAYFSCKLIPPLSPHAHAPTHLAVHYVSETESCLLWISVRSIQLLCIFFFWEM